MSNYQLCNYGSSRSACFPCKLSSWGSRNSYWSISPKPYLSSLKLEHSLLPMPKIRPSSGLRIRRPPNPLINTLLFFTPRHPPASTREFTVSVTVNPGLNLKRNSTLSAYPTTARFASGIRCTSSPGPTCGPLRPPNPSTTSALFP